MDKPGYTGVERVVRAAGYSLQGLAAGWRHESAFRQEVVLAAVLVPLALHLGDGGVERALLLIAIGQVLIVELLNSAVESTVDRIGGDAHPLAGRAKDLGSAAVMLSLVLAGGIWLVVLLS